MAGSPTDSPFARFPGGGRKPLGLNITTNGSFRTHYGPPVMALWGATCCYCERDLAVAYEAWLDASVEHIVPRQLSAKDGWPLEWTEDLANQATCCRACNEFLNGFKVAEPKPASFEEFADVRDRVYLAKRAQVLRRHQKERSLYDWWVHSREG
jgi:hypothetical protein